VELVYQPNGNTTGEELIDVGYIAGGNFQFTLDSTFVGNGTRRIVLRRVNQGGSSMRITARWSGYEQ
jgi:hypothetical protein